MAKKSSKDKIKKDELPPPVEPPVVEQPKAVIKEFVFESILPVARSQHVNRANYDDSALHKFILQHNLHGKVVRIVADSSMMPVNGNLITKYTIFGKEER